MSLHCVIENTVKTIERVPTVIDGVVKELSSMSAIVDSVDKKIFETDIMKRVQSFVLTISNNAYYTIDSNNAFGSRTFVTNASDLTESEYQNLIGKIKITRNGTALIVESPAKTGPAYAQIWLRLYAKLDDGTSVVVNEENGFPITSFTFVFKALGEYVTLVTPSGTNSCRRTLGVNYGEDDSVQGYTAPYTATSCAISYQTFTCGPLKNGYGSYTDLVYIALGSSFAGTSGSAYYRWQFEPKHILYDGIEIPFDNTIRYYTSKTKVINQNVSVNSIVGFDVFLLPYSKIYLSYSYSGTSGSSVIISNFSTITQFNSNYGTYSKTDTKFTISPYTGATPRLYFIVMAKNADGKHIPLAYFSDVQQGKFNIPLTFTKIARQSGGCGSSMDTIQVYTTDSSGNLSLTSKNTIQTVNSILSYNFNVNGGYYTNLYRKTSSGMASPHTNINGASVYMYCYGLGDSASSSVATPKTIMCDITFELGGATISLTDGSTKTVPCSFKISGESPNLLFDI